MCKVIAVASQKGGVGKTTNLHQSWCSISKSRKQSVACGQRSTRALDHWIGIKSRE